MTTNLPAKENTLFAMLQDPALKKQMQLAIPRHMTVDRLLRVAMTAIRTTPKLMDCTPKSLMACIMACAQLGLEPEPFLGQAYFVPFNVNVAPKGSPARWELQATFIPGYRGYIAMARRSGEVQSVTAQAVYANDQFRVQYGLTEELYHIPTDEKRGEFRGAYVIFRYKDGSHSFDWMPKDRIDKVRERSKAKDSGPWITDFDEMAVKTVIRHHVKLVPLSVEIAKAAHLEERAIIGEDQAGLIFGDEEDPKMIEATATEEKSEPEESVSDKLERLAQGEGVLDTTDLKKFIVASATATKKTELEMQTAACADFPAFLAIFNRSMAKKAEREKAEMDAKAKAAKKKAEPPKPIDDGYSPPLKGVPAEPDLSKQPIRNVEAPGPFPGPFPEEVDLKTGEVTQRDPAETKDCPEDGEPRAYGWCKAECPSFIDCGR